MQSTKNIVLEICCADIESAFSALTAGAKRIELCSALSTGGITPSLTVLKEIKKEFPKAEIMVLIRPRSGNFIYSELEKKILLQETAQVLEYGASGIVIGALNNDHSLDFELLDKIRSVAKNYPLTFHRAFDLVADTDLACKQLVDLGYDNILTSGQKKTAIQGRELIRELISGNDDNINIIAGSGINSDNIISLIQYTGSSNIHMSCSNIETASKTNDAFNTDLKKFSLTAYNKVMKQLADNGFSV